MRHCAYDEVNTEFDCLQDILGDCGRAAIQTQGSTSNPFGSTFVYGYQNVAFEVRSCTSPCTWSPVQLSMVLELIRKLHTLRAGNEEWLYCNSNPLPVMNEEQLPGTLLLLLESFACIVLLFFIS